MNRVITTVLLALTLATGGTTACNPAGTVTDKAKPCHKTSSQNEICNYRLKTTDWFDVTSDTYERCQIGEKYPECGDRR